MPPNLKETFKNFLENSHYGWDTSLDLRICFSTFLMKKLIFIIDSELKNLMRLLKNIWILKKIHQKKVSSKCCYILLAFKIKMKIYSKNGMSRYKWILKQVKLEGCLHLNTIFIRRDQIHLYFRKCLNWLKRNSLILQIYLNFKISTD